MQNTDLEFRVLTGLQAGARIRLPSGSYTVGNGLDCDIVLQGQGIEALHLHLLIDEAQCLLRPVAADCGTRHGALAEDIQLAAGQLFRAARVWLQVTLAGVPWPDAEAIALIDAPVDSDRSEEADEPAAEDDIAVEALPETVAEITVVDATVTDSADDAVRQDKADAAASSKMRQRIGVLSVSMLAAVFLGGMAISLVAPGSATTAAPPPPVKNTAALLEDALACTSRVTATLGLREQISAVNDGTTTVTATGKVQTKAELAAFQKAMSTQCPTVQLAVSSADTAAPRTKAPLDLAGVRQQLETLLERAQLTPQISVTVKANRLQVSGNPSAEEARRWEPILAQLQQQYGADLPVSVEFDSVRNALPFRIHQVVGGTMPFIILDDGSRLFEGGTIDGYQLVSIKEHKLIFGGKQSIELNW